MTYFPSYAVTPTPGTAYEAFHLGVHSPMLPQDVYDPRAAGPAYLATDGLGQAHVYYGEPASVPWDIRGLGQLDVGGIIKTYVEPTLDSVIQGAVNRNWPVLQRKLDESLTPVKVLLGLTLVASGAAAIVGVVNFVKKT